MVTLAVLVYLIGIIETVVCSPTPTHLLNYSQQLTMDLLSAANSNRTGSWLVCALHCTVLLYF